MGERFIPLPIVSECKELEWNSNSSPRFHVLIRQTITPAAHPPKVCDKVNQELMTNLVNSLVVNKV